MGVYSGWDPILLKYGGEVFLERRSIFCMVSILVQQANNLVIWKHYQFVHPTFSKISLKMAIQFSRNMYVEL